MLMTIFPKYIAINHPPSPPPQIDLNWCQSLEMAHLMRHLLLTKTSQIFVVILFFLNGQINNRFLRFSYIGIQIKSKTMIWHLKEEIHSCLICGPLWVSTNSKKRGASYVHIPTNKHEILDNLYWESIKCHKFGVVGQSMLIIFLY